MITVGENTAIRDHLFGHSGDSDLLNHKLAGFLIESYCQVVVPRVDELLA